MGAEGQEQHHRVDKKKTSLIAGATNLWISLHRTLRRKANSYWLCENFVFVIIVNRNLEQIENKTHCEQKKMVIAI